MSRRGYADALGDHNPIHVDDPNVAEGRRPSDHPGLCTMAFTSQAVIRTIGGELPPVTRLLAVRFSKPVLPGELTTRIWTAGARVEERKSYRFETPTTKSGALVTNGIAEVS
ncbi:MAG: MaoC/PaaZ C-terminal domain-containing protein [Acidobacteriota bacterium]